MVNFEFRKVCEFFRINKLVLHPDKTKFILFSRSNYNNDNLQIFCNNNNHDQNTPNLIHSINRVLPSDTVPAVKFLGVLFDPDLNFKYHIANLRSKLSRALYALRTLKNTLSTDSLLLLYNSIFHCHLLYAVIIWSCSRSGQITDLFKMQKAAIRIVTNSSSNFLPSSFNDIWLRNSIRNIGENEIQLRNFAQLQNVHSNLTKLDIFPLYNFPKIWENFTDEQIKILRKKSEFDHKLKDYFLNDLAATVSCNRLLCPACLAGRS